MTMTMTTRILTGATVCLVCLTNLACGPSKPAEDATKESSASAGDETPKWDSSSETASTAKSGKSSEGSSGGADTSEGAAAAPARLTPSPAPTARRLDVYDKDETEVVLRRAARQVKDNCGFATNDDGKQVGPWGKATVSIVLGHNGHSKGVTVPAPFDGKPTGNCVIKAFSNLTIPPWSGPDTTVDWEVEVAQPKAAK